MYPQNKKLYFITEIIAWASNSLSRENCFKQYFEKYKKEEKTNTLVTSQ